MEHRSNRLGRTLARYLAGAIVLAIFIAGGLAVRIMQFAHDGSPQPADAILVLGAAQYNGRPSQVFQARLDHAAELYRDGKARHIVTVGGGQEGDTYTEGDSGAKYLAGIGIKSAALIAVPLGSDTLVSIRAAGKVLNRHSWESVIVVTDPWHMARCRMIARDLGFDVEVSPVTQGPATADSVESRYIVRELLGTLFYRLIGGSSGSGSAVL